MSKNELVLFEVVSEPEKKKQSWCWLGFHNWNPWQDDKITSIWDFTYDKNPKFPCRREMTQTKRCVDCNQVKARKVIV